MYLYIYMNAHVQHLIYWQGQRVCVMPCFSWCLDNFIALLSISEEVGLNHHSDKKLT
jgi:hypothetical protein